MPVLLACAIALGGCSVDIGGFSFMSEKNEGRGVAPASTAIASAPVRAVPQGALLTAEGVCESDAAGQTLPPTIAEGITECELVKLKGAKPTDVLIGESGKGQRETQVLYSETGGREIYLFTDNRLARIVKPGQG
jgi:hypothetical protein